MLSGAISGPRGAVAGLLAEPRADRGSPADLGDLRRYVGEVGDPRRAPSMIAAISRSVTKDRVRCDTSWIVTAFCVRAIAAIIKRLRRPALSRAPSDDPR